MRSACMVVNARRQVALLTHVRGGRTPTRRFGFGRTIKPVISADSGRGWHSTQLVERTPCPTAQVPNVEVRPTLVVRSLMEPAILTSALRKAATEVDPEVPMDQVATMD